MGGQDGAGRVVPVGDVLAVLELARAHLDAAAPVPASWDAVIARMRAVLLAQAVPPVPDGALAQAPVPGDSTGQHESTRPC
jgi:hypothetical protein